MKNPLTFTVQFTNNGSLYVTHTNNVDGTTRMCPNSLTPDGLKDYVKEAINQYENELLEKALASIGCPHPTALTISNIYYGKSKANKP